MTDDFADDLPEDDGISLLDIMQTLADNARLLIVGPLIAGLLALGVSFLFAPNYVAETNIMIPQQQGGVTAALAQLKLGALADMAGATGLKSPSEMYVGLLKSRTIADRMIDRFSMMNAPGVKTHEDAREMLARISGFVARRDGQITIGAVSRIPGLSAAVANAYVEELSALTARLAVTDAQKRRLFLEKELARAKENLVLAEIALGGANVSGNLLKFNPVAMGQGLATLKTQIMAKEVQLSSMRGVLTENSPGFRQAQRELAALRAQLDTFERTPPSSGNAEYIRRYRDFKYSEAVFEQFARQYELAKVDEASEGAVIQVVDVALPPEETSNMHKALVAILGWLVVGIVLLLFVFVRRALRNAKQNLETAAKLAAVRAGFGRALKPKFFWRRQVKVERNPAD